MGALDGRIAIITGAGRGLGREHALLFASEGARVVVNDLGGEVGGGGADATPAQETAQLIKEMGAEAIVNGDDVSDWEGAQRMINQCVETFGGLDVLVNNAGILRDRVIVNMTDAEWDSVIKVHMRGHFCTIRFAATYWREQAKAGTARKASVINTSSESGLFGNPGQANYGAAKSGIATLTQIASKELQRYGVRANAIAPRARTRMTEQVPGLGDIVKAEVAEGQFDVWDPSNVSPFVAYLATEDCPITGQVFMVWSDEVIPVKPWTLDDEHKLKNNGERWTLDQLAKAAPALQS